MAWKALVQPRKWVTDLPGMCLRYAQSFFGAPVMYQSAWEAWLNQRYRHDASEPLPNVPVVLWFSHYGTYGEPATYKNWGHVAPLVPGDAIYSSPATWNAGWSYSRFGTIAELENALNCKYVGWSEDLNGLRIAQYESPTQKPQRKRRNKDMLMCYYAHAAGQNQGRWLVFGPKFQLILSTQNAANQIAQQLGITAFNTDGGGWHKYLRASK